MISFKFVIIIFLLDGVNDSNYFCWCKYDFNEFSSIKVCAFLTKELNQAHDVSKSDCSDTLFSKTGEPYQNYFCNILNFVTGFIGILPLNDKTELQCVAVLYMLTQILCNQIFLVMSCFDSCQTKSQ